MEWNRLIDFPSSVDLNKELPRHINRIFGARLNIKAFVEIASPGILTRPYATARIVVVIIMFLSLLVSWRATSVNG